MQRCKVKSKRGGEQCKKHAIKSCGACRMHGAHGDPKTREGWLNCKKVSLKHGRYSQETIEEMRFMRKLLKEENNLDQHTDTVYG